jgi:hypothetical protein
MFPVNVVYLQDPSLEPLVLRRSVVFSKTAANPDIKDVRASEWQHLREQGACNELLHKNGIDLRRLCVLRPELPVALERTTR